MKKLLFISLFLVANVNSDVDLGDDFAAGDLVTADAFNTKFNALNGVVGEIVDADLLGSWTCTAYKNIRIDDSDTAYDIAGGGNGLVDQSSFFKSRTSTLKFVEPAGAEDTVPSLNSPWIWGMDTPDVLFNSVVPGTPEINGSYALLANKLHFVGQNNNYLGIFYVHKLSASKFTLVHLPQPDINREVVAGPGVRQRDIICEAIVEDDATSD